MSRPRQYSRLGPGERRHLADALRDLAGHIDHPNAPNVARNLEAAATATGYPRGASGAGGPRANQVDEDGRPIAPDTPTEAAALHPDPTAQAALAALAALNTIQAAVGPALDALSSWTAGRPVAMCPRCAHWIPFGSDRCTWVDPKTGRRCSTSASRPTTAYCRNPACAAPLVAGKISHDRCPSCARHWSEHGVERIPRDALALADNVIVAEDGTATAMPEGQTLDDYADDLETTP